MTLLAIDRDVLPLGVEVSTTDLLDVDGAGYCETMVFGGEYDQECDRTYDRDDARMMHDRVVTNLRIGREPFGGEDEPEPTARSLSPEAWSPMRRRAYLAGMRQGIHLMTDSPGLRLMLLRTIETEQANLTAVDRTTAQQFCTEHPRHAGK